MDLADFDRYCDEHAITDAETPAAFAAWLNERTGWDGSMAEVRPTRTGRSVPHDN